MTSALQFDPSLLKEYSVVLNASPIFHSDEQLKKQFNLLCVVMRRLESCVGYLNKHPEPPATEEDFMSYMMFGCMMVDAIKELHKQTAAEDQYKGNKQFFIDAVKELHRRTEDFLLGEPLNFSEEECPSDDQFFRYLRALIFAHPYETSKHRLIKKGEIQYSPWVIVGGNYVGVTIYSSLKDESVSLRFPFEQLLAYFRSRYEALGCITEWMNGQITEKQEEWSKRKVDRSLDSLELLRDIADILQQRHETDCIYTLEMAISFMECGCSKEENEEAVGRFRLAIGNALPAVCDALERFNYNEMRERLDAVVCAEPANLHSGAYYQLEKIRTYLDSRHNGPENIHWGLQQAANFEKEYAHKYVCIDTTTMEFDEIKMLVAAALYLGSP